MIKSPDEIYEVLDKVFESGSVTSPLTCVDLMDRPAVRGAAINRWGSDIQEATEKLSDTLGFMWRRGLLDRFPAPANGRTRARYAYAKQGMFKDFDTPIKYIAPEKTKNKGNLEIVEKDGELVINLEGFTIVIRPK